MKKVILSLLFGMFCMIIKPVELNDLKEWARSGDVQNIAGINLSEEDLIECISIALESEHDSYDGNLKAAQEALSPDTLTESAHEDLLKEGDDLRFCMIDILLKRGNLSETIIGKIKEKIDESSKLREYFIEKAQSFISKLSFINAQKFKGRG